LKRACSIVKGESENTLTSFGHYHKFKFTKSDSFSAPI